jgi:hypothetical protein
MINPYLDQTIADQFQAEADLSEFDRLDIAVLGNVANKKKNDIGINTLKQKAAFGIHPQEAVANLHAEKRQAEEELVQRQAETQQLANVYASTSNDMEAPMGYGGLNDAFNPPRPTPPAGWNPYKGAIVDNWGSGASPESIAFPNGAADQVAPNPYLSRPTYKANLDMTGMPGSKTVSPVTVPIMETMEPVMPGSTPPAPAGPYTPGSYTAGLNTQLGSEMEGLYGMKREYAPDAAYNQAMAAVREALGKAPNVPTMAKPQLTQEDQALIALAGIFGGFQNMPQALQGALAGAQQRAEIQNQQLQNKFQQEQAVYGRQLQALQGIAQTEEERRKQAQETLDRQYEQAYRTRLGGIEKLKANISNAPLKEQELAQKQQESAQKKETADANAQAKVRQANKAMLDKDYQTYYKILETKMKQPYITKADYEGLLGRRNGLIEKYKNSGMGDIGSLFYVPQVGVTPDTARKQVQDAYDFGMRTGRRITKEIGGSFFGDVDASPVAPDTLKELNKLQDNYRKYANKDTELDKRWRELAAQAARFQTPSGGDGRGMMGTFKQFTVKPENKKKFDELVKEIEKVKTQKEANKKLLKPAQSKFEKMAKDLGIPLVPSKTPGNKTSQNTVETPLGTLTFNA